MRITQSADHRDPNAKIIQALLDIAAKLFPVAVIAFLVIYGYLLYGIFSGQLVDGIARSAAEKQHVVDVVNNLTMWLNISLIVGLVCCCVQYYEQETLGVILLLIAAFQAYGLQFLSDWLFAADASKYKPGSISKETFEAITGTAVIFAIPGVLLVLRQLYVNIMSGARRRDLSDLTYGKGVKRESRPKPLLAAAARCWELPFCREGIRKQCPIFHAKTKCWKERVGCMCEENIILTAMGGGAAAAVNMTESFVPIGDLITKTTVEAPRVAVPTRKGPRGVRIPTNPHLNFAQKVERCRNCVIYNEHQRQKYKLLAPLVTLIVPALVFLQYDNLRVFVENGLRMLTGSLAHISWNADSAKHADKVVNDLTGSFSIELVLIICLTLVIMTWALRFLEYCMFKIKI